MTSSTCLLILSVTLYCVSSFRIFPLVGRPPIVVSDGVEVYSNGSENFGSVIQPDVVITARALTQSETSIVPAEVSTKSAAILADPNVSNRNEYPNNSVDFKSTIEASTKTSEIITDSSGSLPETVEIPKETSNTLTETSETPTVISGFPTESREIQTEISKNLTEFSQVPRGVRKILKNRKPLTGLHGYPTEQGEILWATETLAGTSKIPTVSSESSQETSETVTDLSLNSTEIHKTLTETPEPLTESPNESNETLSYIGTLHKFNENVNKLPESSTVTSYSAAETSGDPADPVEQSNSSATETNDIPITTSNVASERNEILAETSKSTTNANDNLNRMRQSGTEINDTAAETRKNATDTEDYQAEINQSVTDTYGNLAETIKSATNTQYKQVNTSTITTETNNNSAETIKISTEASDNSVDTSTIATQTSDNQNETNILTTVNISSNISETSLISKDVIAKSPEVFTNPPQTLSTLPDSTEATTEIKATESLITTTTTTKTDLFPQTEFLPEISIISLNLLPPKTEYRKFDFDPRYDDWSKIPADIERLLIPE